MTTIRTLMTDNHRHCDDLFAAAEQAVGKGDFALANTAFGLFRTAMLAHFDGEEKTLFPTFEAKTGMTSGPTQVMRMEHAQIRALMDEAVDALKAENSDEYLGLGDTIVIMMQQHNMKEEGVLYPMCDQHLSAELLAVIKQLEADLSEQ